MDTYVGECRLCESETDCINGICLACSLKGNDITKADEEALRHGVCPDCQNDSFIEGPSAGLSTNIMCTECKSKFNMGPLTPERI